MQTEKIVGLLKESLWQELYAPSEVICMAELPVLTKKATAFLKSKLDHPDVQSIRKQSKTGKPGPIDAKALTAVIKNWIAGLPAYLDHQSDKGIVRRLTLLRGTKRIDVFVLEQGAEHQVSLSSELRELRDCASSLGRHLEAVHSAVQKLQHHGSATQEVGSGVPNPEQSLKRAYESEDGSHRGFVPIHKVRRSLEWSKEKFDATLVSLRKGLAIELQVGSPADYTKGEILDSFVETDGTLYLTMSWRQQE